MAERVHETHVGGGSPFKLYKSGQGQYVRWSAAAGAGLLSLAAAAFTYQRLTVFNNEWVERLVPVAVLVALAYFIFRMVGQHTRVVDFMIATEGEMKKVNWSSRKEVWGATKVVIITVLALAILLFLVDILFIVLFSAMNVLHVDLLGNLFSRGEP